MELTLSKPSVVVVRMANKFAVCRAEYVIEAYTNQAASTTITCSLPDSLEFTACGKEEVVPSIISNSAQATLTINGTAAAGYISNRCSQIGCDQTAKSTIEGGQVGPIEADTLVALPD